MTHRVGFIGTGEIARLHAAALARMEGWEPAAGYDANGETGAAFCRGVGCAQARSAEEIFEDGRIDTVYICTRHDSHAQLAAAACRAGKNIFLEKPVALTPQAARPLEEAYRENPVPLAVGYNMRVTPAVERLKALLKQHGARPDSFRASMTGPPFMDGWASDPAAGGGVLVCQGSHMFDLLAHVLGSPVAAVCAATQHLRLPKEREPNAAALLVKLANGVCGTLLLHDRGTAAYHAQNEGRMVNLTVYAPEGTFDADAYGKVRWGTQGGFFEELPSPDRSQLVSWGYMAQARAFARLLETGESPLCGLKEALRTARAVAAAKTAAQGGWAAVQYTAFNQ